jgi:hypothetical protein
MQWEYSQLHRDRSELLGQKSSCQEKRKTPYNLRSVRAQRRKFTLFGQQDEHNIVGIQEYLVHVDIFFPHHFSFVRDVFHYSNYFHCSPEHYYFLLRGVRKTSRRDTIDHCWRDQWPQLQPISNCSSLVLLTNRTVPHRETRCA